MNGVFNAEKVVDILTVLARSSEAEWASTNIGDKPGVVGNDMRLYKVDDLGDLATQWIPVLFRSYLPDNPIKSYTDLLGQLWQGASRTWSKTSRHDIVNDRLLELCTLVAYQASLEYPAYKADIQYLIKRSISGWLKMVEAYDDKLIIKHILNFLHSSPISEFSHTSKIQALAAKHSITLEKKEDHLYALANVDSKIIRLWNQNLVKAVVDEVRHKDSSKLNQLVENHVKDVRRSLMGEMEDYFLPSRRKDSAASSNELKKIEEVTSFDSSRYIDPLTVMAFLATFGVTGEEGTKLHIASNSLGEDTAMWSLFFQGMARAFISGGGRDQYDKDRLYDVGIIVPLLWASQPTLKFSNCIKECLPALLNGWIKVLNPYKNHTDTIFVQETLRYLELFDQNDQQRAEIKKINTHHNIGKLQPLNLKNFELKEIDEKMINFYFESIDEKKLKNLVNNIKHRNTEEIHHFINTNIESIQMYITQMLNQRYLPDRVVQQPSMRSGAPSSSSGTSEGSSSRSASSFNNALNDI